MDENTLGQHLNKMRLFYQKNITKDIHFRKETLQRLYDNIKKHENDIMDALSEDLSKSNFESYVTEISMVLNEIKCQKRHLAKWSKVKKKRMPLFLFPSKSAIMPEPYGLVLIIAPWNYPFQLLINPLVGCIAAGNCAVLKTSPNAPAIAKVMETIIQETFPPEYVSIFHGNRQVNQELLAERFDYIFFTGSPQLGKIVMEAASHHLTPVTLELGGKSPCIIDKDADLKVTAHRIIWGKTINCGQTCIAPDYLFVHQDIKEELSFEIKNAIEEMYGQNPQEAPDYPRIISEVAMKRLVGYLSSGDVLIGGHYDFDDLYIEPTILENVPEEAPILHEEVFGPIFALKTFTAIDEVIQYLQVREKPLALYYFSKDKANIKRLLRTISSGGACINDTLIHVSNDSIPFGGVGNSGMGHYHGKYSFDTFTHLKSVAFSKFIFDMKIKYPPYKDKLNLFKKLI